MSKINKVMGVPSNVTFLSNRARAHWASHHGASKDFVYVCSEHYSGTVMTQEAYAFYKNFMGLRPITVAFIAPQDAALTTDEVLTKEEVEETYKKCL